MSFDFNPEEYVEEPATGTKRSAREFPTPEEGSQLGVVNLIVDLGKQELEDFEDPNTGEKRPQKPARQFGVFIDLPESIVDYGGSVGEKPFRLRTVKSFKGNIKGWKFTKCYPMKDNQVDFDAMPTFHANNPFRKLAIATGQEQIFRDKEHNMDISQLLGKTCMVDVKVTPWEKGDKSGVDVKFGGASKAKSNYIEKMFPEGIPDCGEPMLITFDNATADNVKFIHKDLREFIKGALNYEGSMIQKAFVEAGYDTNTKVEDELSANEPENIGPAVDEFDDDIPF